MAVVTVVDHGRSPSAWGREIAAVTIVLEFVAKSGLGGRGCACDANFFYIVLEFALVAETGLGGRGRVLALDVTFLFAFLVQAPFMTVVS